MFVLYIINYYRIMTNTRKDGYHMYSGAHYDRIKKLREDTPVYNEYQKQIAIKTNRKLLKEFQELQTMKTRQTLPFGSKFIYRGVKNINNTANYQQNSQGNYSKDYKSYISFSRSIDVAKQFASGGPVHSPAILLLDIREISKKVPIIYNGVWGFQSQNPQEQEVLLPPGRLIISRHPLRHVKHGHHKIPILHVVNFFPNKATRNLSTGKVNPYKKK